MTKEHYQEKAEMERKNDRVGTGDVSVEKLETIEKEMKSWELKRKIFIFLKALTWKIMFVYILRKSQGRLF